MNAQDMSIGHLILNASWVVQLVMLLLVAGSIASWITIFQKSLALRDARKLNAEFEEDFWSGASLNDLYAAAVQNARSSGPVERMFANGMREYHKLRERRISQADTLLDGARRAMMASFNREMDALENGLSFLGTVGSISPYVGLFGTVWGIMHAFTGFASMEQISLATVAPGIAEALVATAMGLFAAIPAVVAYNRFSREIDRTAIRLETFGDEFTNILQRNLSASGAPSSPPNPAPASQAGQAGL
ncbi:MAG: protein TolQ [Comamonadaceae bacterium]|nr:protein TolQ [Comamonadaceae bacterium]